jgi:hypothetical protein
MTIYGLHALKDHSARGVSHVLSILDPGWPEAEAFWAYDPQHRTTLYFHDIIAPRGDLILPSQEHVEAILWRRSWPLASRWAAQQGRRARASAGFQDRSCDPAARRDPARLPWSRHCAHCGRDCALITCPKIPAETVIPGQRGGPIAARAKAPFLQRPHLRGTAP